VKKEEWWLQIGLETDGNNKKKYSSLISISIFFGGNGFTSGRDRFRNGNKICEHMKTNKYRYKFNAGKRKLRSGSDYMLNLLSKIRS